ncbi:hypothetical protein C1W84_10560 [Burkholderia pseudomallei]|nr:hypothetical protein [Burkholderia pseudomallei]NAX13251.1 hypothetical protein [Burkholderia pseudomallei]NAX56926.1 hypothetical protein [Burkholderia pseudomallei]NAX66832.1 hypothetical protein [Burkholderia pseudomallei]NAX74173.1 hypothetical protein [Burkholderia pseudomallei]
MLSPSRSAARRGIRRCSITASATFRRASSRMLMVISSKLAHDALRQFKPPAACAETLELRHFNLAQMRHDNFALAPEMSIIVIMSNIVCGLIATIRAIKAALSLTITRPATA